MSIGLWLDSSVWCLLIIQFVVAPKIPYLPRAGPDAVPVCLQCESAMGWLRRAGVALTHSHSHCRSYCRPPSVIFGDLSAIVDGRIASRTWTANVDFFCERRMRIQCRYGFSKSTPSRGP
ncbi:hypothetical protein B0T13DRAFT_456808 [Neurospora crassa]|nr:hypothetical protein B0T13DRAFT_456808 [Neurospora crassa]